MKMINRNIDSDALDPFFQERMSEADLKYYKYFNKLWNTGYYQGDMFPKNHARDIKNMVRARQKTDIFYKDWRLDSTVGDRIIENCTSEEYSVIYNGNGLIPLNIADSVAANNGSVYAIAYLAEELKNAEALYTLQGNIAQWIAIIGRIVAEERRSKRRKAHTLDGLQVHYLTAHRQSGVDKVAAKILKNNSVNEALESIIEPLAKELKEAGGEILRKQMLFDKGLLVATLIKKGYNKKRNKK